jgi:pimeloyl-ACP methyl ester carboxylesterase
VTVTRTRPDAPGRLVDIGGYRLHLDCRGEGGPTAIFEGGTGEAGLSWTLVHPQVAGFTRACVYDRAGLGWSEPSPKPRTANVMVEELRALLDASQVKPPFVLVAQSFGGIVARLAFPPETAEAYRALVASDTTWLDTLVAELQAVAEAHAQVREAEIRSLGDIPLVVLRHRKPIGAMPGIEAEDMDRYERTWQELQEELVALSPRGSLVVAEESGHMIHQDQPDLVVRVARDVVDAVRA